MQKMNKVFIIHDMVGLVLQLQNKRGRSLPWLDVAKNRKVCEPFGRSSDWRYTVA